MREYDDTRRVSRASLEAEIEDLETQISVLDETNHELQRENKELEKDNAALLREIDELEEQLRVLRLGAGVIDAALDVEHNTRFHGGCSMDAFLEIVAEYRRRNE
jgi:septal ring factor EnvC (AmiA/AmiB activator)